MTKVAPTGDPVRTVYINEAARNVEFKFPNNHTSTTKYTWWNFLPKQLFEQFRRLCNFYFLLVVCIQFVPDLSPLNPFSSIFPLCLVLVISGVKEAVEDRRRANQDKETNRRPVDVFRDGRWQSVTWESLHAGEVVKVVDGKYFPADLVLLSSSAHQGLCYIETSNLDGETNLKIRQSVDQTMKMTEDQVPTFTAVVNCEQPNNRLYTFTGSIAINGRDTPLAIRQLLLRGSMLRNTGWIIGCTVFTGHDTKLMRNSTSPPSKRSSLDRLMNIQVVAIFIFQLVICIGTAVGTFYFFHNALVGAFYLGGLMYENSVLAGLKAYFTFIILLNVMIPISLYVSAEIVRVVQARLMETDLAMYHPDTDTPAKARTSNLNEELGQVSYIFSDKTGTLTQNKMEFLKCTVNGVSYGYAVTEAAIGAAKRENRDVARNPLAQRVKMEGDFYFDDSRISQALIAGGPQGNAIDQFFTLLAVCHTVIPEVQADGSVKYQASSPDEGALVIAAKGFGFEFAARDADAVTIMAMRKSRTYRILNVLEFDSTRKRMSVIVRDPDGKILLMCKGADTVIYERLRPGQETIKATTHDHLSEFAQEGLRTLCLAYCELAEKDYQPFNERFQIAAKAIVDRDKKLAEVAETIEKNLILIGATAIEDKLQDGVADTIATMLEANCKVWVLTGDKQETAINIGFSCALLYESMHLFVVEGETHDDVAKCLEECRSEAERLRALGKQEQALVPDFGLVVEGAPLEYLLGDELKPKLLSFAMMCKSVICCRVSPLQKALVVRMVKDSLKGVVTLAIGDGANDVSMIQAAHIGVGISGNEGMQAVMASDYAIAQFRFLKRLLLVHGRWNYKRVSLLILYSFYKNMTFAFPQFLFAFWSGFSGQTLYESTYVAMFNVLFTGLPILVYSSLEQDVSANLAMQFPSLYIAGQQNKSFNLKLFGLWLANALYHAFTIFWVAFLMFPSLDSRISGSVPVGMGHAEVYYFGALIYTNVVIVVNLRLALETCYWTWIGVLAVAVSIASWFIVVLVFSSFVDYLSELYSMAMFLFADPAAWLCICLTAAMCLVPNVAFKFIWRQWRPQSVHIVQELLQKDLAIIREARLKEEMKNKLMLSGSLLPAAKGASAHLIRQRTGFGFAQEPGQVFAGALMPLKEVETWKQMTSEKRSPSGEIRTPSNLRG